LNPGSVWLIPVTLQVVYYVSAPFSLEQRGRQLILIIIF